MPDVLAAAAASVSVSAAEGASMAAYRLKYGGGGLVLGTARSRDRLMKRRMEGA